MGTVTITGVVYTIYGTYSGAGSMTEYAGAQTAPGFVTWRALVAAGGASLDDAYRSLVMATLELDRQQWAGAKTSAVQAQQWPRTGVTRADGTAVDSATVPIEIVQACYELAAQFVLDASLADAANANSNLKRAKAGSAEVEYFRPTVGGRFSTAVQELVGQFLAGAGSASGPYVAGTDVESSFDADDAYPLTRAP